MPINGASRDDHPKAASIKRKDHDCAQRDQHAADGAEREEQRYDVEPDDAALLLLVVNDVQRIEDRLHAGIGAPERDTEAERKAEAQPAVAASGDPRDFLAQEVERSARNDIGGERDMVGDRGRVGKERIDRHARGDGREQRNQRIEHHPGREREQPVVLHLMVGADEDVLPAAPGDMHGGRRLAAPALLTGARFLQRQRLECRIFRPERRLGLAVVVVALHRIDDRRGGQHRRGKPGNQTLNAGFGGALGHTGCCRGDECREQRPTLESVAINENRANCSGFPRFPTPLPPDSGLKTARAPVPSALIEGRAASAPFFCAQHCPDNAEPHAQARQTSNRS